MFLGLLIFRSIKYNGRCIQQSNNKNWLPLGSWSPQDLIIKMPYNYDPFGMYFVKLKSYSQKRWFVSFVSSLYQ